MDKAQNLLKIAIEKDRDCSLVIWSTTRLYLKEQKYNEALKLITIGLQNFKNDLEWLSLLSTCLRENNRYVTSIEVWKDLNKDVEFLI